jgi:hypothetical protein
MIVLKRSSLCHQSKEKRDAPRGMNSHSVPQDLQCYRFCDARAWPDSNWTLRCRCLGILSHRLKFLNKFIGTARYDFSHPGSVGSLRHCCCDGLLNARRQAKQMISSSATNPNSLVVIFSRCDQNRAERSRRCSPREDPGEGAQADIGQKLSPPPRWC